MLIPASAIASSPTKIAKCVTSGAFLGITPLSINCLRSSGVATTKTASIMTVHKKMMMLVRYGLAKTNIRFTVPAFNFCSLTDGSAVIDRWVIQAACWDM